MNRVIRFRGYIECFDKTLERYVYGTLDKKKYDDNGLPEKGDNKYIIITDNGIKYNKVIQDSIGQYSGYIDINEEEIYEGDILRFGNYPFEEVRKAKVVYDNGFYIEILEGECPVLENKRIEMKGDLEQYGMEVIGTEFEEVRNGEI